MADGTYMDSEDRATGPTYKSLFLATCAIIGSAFGWWITDFIADYRALAARVAVLEIRDTEHQWTFKIHSEKIDKLERWAGNDKK